MTSEEEIAKYKFKTVDDPSHYSNIFTKENFKTLEKWGLAKNMELVKFSFNMEFKLVDLERFLKDLLNDKTIKQNFPPLQQLILPKEKTEISQVKYKVLGTKATNMDIFEPMYENNIVTEETGYIHQDYDIYVEDITVDNKLLQAFLCEETEYYSVFDETTRNEFLFHIFQRICIGGAMNQRDNSVEPYLDMTKCFYKDIVSAAKDPESKELYIRSVPVQILDIEGGNIYKKIGHPQNFFYIIIDPYQRYVHLWYHNWIPFW